MQAEQPRKKKTATERVCALEARINRNRWTHHPRRRTTCRVHSHW